MALPTAIRLVTWFEVSILIRTMVGTSGNCSHRVGTRVHHNKHCDYFRIQSNGHNIDPSAFHLASNQHRHDDYN